MYSVLMTTLFYKALILQGEIWCWSLLGFKGLTTSIVWKYSLRVFVWKATLQDFVHRLRQKLEKHLSDNNQVGHFWVLKPLTFKTRVRAKPSLWKWVLFVWEHLASLENRGVGQLWSGLFFCNLISLLNSEYKTKTLQNVNKLKTLQNTKYPDKFRCTLFRLESQK